MQQHHIASKLNLSAFISPLLSDSDKLHQHRQSRTDHLHKKEY